MSKTIAGITTDLDGEALRTMLENHLHTNNRKMVEMSKQNQEIQDYLRKSETPEQYVNREGWKHMGSASDDV